MLLRNIKYGDNVVMLGELLKRKFNIIIDGSSRFTYLDNAIFLAFVKIVRPFFSIFPMQLASNAT